MALSDKFSSPPPRIISLISLVLVATVLTFPYMSCNKDESKLPTISHDTRYDTYYKILTFIETVDGKQLTHPPITPRTTYSPEDVIEYIEGAMNLEYADARITWESYDTKTDTFTIVMSSGYASQQAVEDLFEEVRDSASVHFYSIEESDKFPSLYDAINISPTPSLFTLSVTSMVGKVHKTLTPFGSTDYWSVFPNAGHCAPMSGSTDNASDRLDAALNDYYSAYGCGVWTNVTQVSVDEDLVDYGWGAINEEDPNPGDFIIDYRTFYAICPNHSQLCEDFVDNGIYCLDPDEMNYYFQSIIGIYTDFMNDSGLQHMESGFGLFESIGTNNEWYWVGSDYFGTRSDCDEGNNFPFYLPQCC